MKNIIVLKSVENQGNVTIDGNNPIFLHMSMTEVLDKFIPYTRLFEQIIVKNFYSLDVELINRLTNQYLHGAKIRIEIPKHYAKKKICVRNRVEPVEKYIVAEPFTKTYQVQLPRKFYSYKWVPLDFKHLPKSLANYTYSMGNRKTTVLDELNKLTSMYLPTHLWEAIDKYSQERIDKAKLYNQGNYTLAEEWYKELMKDSINHKFFFKSPCQKTYFEAIAEIEFDKTRVQLENGEQPLTNQELNFLHTYAHCYGVDIPQFQFRYNTRNTDHGYTEEIERVYEKGLGETELNRLLYDPKNPNQLPSFARKNLAIKSYDNDKLLRDAYNHLKWLIDNLGDSAFDIRYHRCPVCNDIYHEEKGCFCGHCPPIKEIPADKLFYGHSSAYEDMDATKDAYTDLMDMLHYNDDISVLQNEIENGLDTLDSDEMY